MSHLRRRLPSPLFLVAALAVLVLAASAALLLSRRAGRADDQNLPPHNLQALGVPMDQLPHAAALLQAELDKIKAAGEPLTLVEMAPPPVPAAQNAALVYLQAFKALKGDLWSQKPSATTPFAALEQQYVAENAAAIALLEKAAALPRCRWPVDWSQGPEEAQLAAWPRCEKLRECAQLLATRMCVQARQGHTDEALRTCTVGLPLVKGLADEPSIVGALVRDAASAILMSGLRQALGLETPPALGGYAAPQPLPPLPSTPACQALFTQLGQAGSFSLHRAMLGERAGGIAELNKLRDDPAEFGALTLSPKKDWPRWAALYAPPRGQQVVDLDEAAYLQAMAAMIKEMDLPYRQGAAALAKTQARIQALPAYCLFTRLATRVFGEGEVQHRDQALADLGRAQIALALVAYHNQIGQWPETLGQLRRAVGWHLPLDPFSGKDFVYRREGEGWVLYSLGPDLKDDGGKGLSAPAANGVRAGDLVWRRK